MRFTPFVLVACGALLGLVACDEDPTDIGTGEASAIVANRATTTQRIGGQFTVAASVIDNTGTRLPVTIQATANPATALRVDSTVFLTELAETRFFITPLVLDTTANLVLTAAGVSDTVFVSSLPFTINAAVRDSVLSGDTATITVTGTNTAGADIGPVPFRVSSVADTNIARVTSAGAVTAKTAGTTNVIVIGPSGMRDTVAVRVVPVPFTGSVSGPSAYTGGGQAITITGSAARPIDGSNVVTLSTPEAGMVVESGTNSRTVVVPHGTPAGTYTFTVTNLGTDQITERGSFTVASDVSESDNFEPNDTPATASVGLTPGTPLVGSFAGADVDDYFTLVVGTDGTYDVSLDWNDGADLDVYILNALGTLVTCGDDFMGCDAASSAHPEEGSATLAAGTYRVYVNLFEGDAPVTTYILRVTRRP